MLSVLDVVLYGIGAVILLIWLALYVMGLKYANLFEPLDEKEYPFKEIYFVGYAALEFIHYQYKSKRDRKLRKEVSVFFGEKYADYYIRVIYAQKLTLSFTVLTIAVPMFGAANSILTAFVMIMLSVSIYSYYGSIVGKKIQKRSEEMLHDFSNVVSKLALLTNAGMIMREAWEEVAFTGNSALYMEMQKSVDEMNNGVSEIDALFNFGTRCIIPEIKKFTSTIVQGIIKGNSELTLMLQQQSKEVWSLRKQDVRRQGEKAASKLLLPIMIMFIGILIMILIPIFANIGA